MSIKEFITSSLTEKIYSQGKNYNPAMDFKIFPPDFFTEFFNTEVIKSRKDEEEALKTQILADWPWLIAYWSRKQIIVGQEFRNAKAIEIPTFPR